MEDKMLLKIVIPDNLEFSALKLVRDSLALAQPYRQPLNPDTTPESRQCWRGKRFSEES